MVTETLANMPLGGSVNRSADFQTDAISQAGAAMIDVRGEGGERPYISTRRHPELVALSHDRMHRHRSTAGGFGANPPGVNILRGRRTA
jgi:hypothetical protein